MATETARVARAKVNLCLHVTGRRPDGYHLLDSLVVFPATGDRIVAERSATLSLTVEGPFASDLPADGDNLVLRAAALMPQSPAALRLEKNLPLAAGLGGGSADAAATLLALSALSGAPLPAAAQVLALGADVPVCLKGRPARMQGIGEVVSDIPALPPGWCVLANPRVACPTPQVFAGLAERNNPPLPPLPDRFADMDALAGWLRTTRNDLEAPAIALRPVIAEVLSAIAATGGCLLARMSGSGATVFGLYASEVQALAAAGEIRSLHPAWWVVAAPL